MNQAMMKNGGAFCRAAFLDTATDVTAGGAGDATPVVTAYVDRNANAALGDFNKANSAKIMLSYSVTLAANETITIGSCSVKDATSAAGAGAADITSGMSSQVITDTGSGGTYTGVLEWDVALDGARDFVAFAFTPDMSAAVLDTAELVPVIMFFGSDNQPSSGAPVSSEETV